MRDLWGDVLEEIVAPQDGVVLFITSSPAVGDDGLLLGLGAELDDLGDNEREGLMATDSIPGSTQTRESVPFRSARQTA